MSFLERTFELQIIAFLLAAVLAMWLTS